MIIISLLSFEANAQLNGYHNECSRSMNFSGTVFFQYDSKSNAGSGIELGMWGSRSPLSIWAGISMQSNKPVSSTGDKAEAATVNTPATNNSAAYTPYLKLGFRVARIDQMSIMLTTAGRKYGNDFQSANGLRLTYQVGDKIAFGIEPTIISGKNNVFNTQLNCSFLF